jgi:L-cysteine:1D-myo-inositol 2-amino-2-deoxy-alpha-D-glucopyranoside ligase
MQFYNTFSGTTEKFKPLQKNKVRIYVCGVTPYDTSHLGHAFVFITFDTLIRFLRYKGYEVSYVQNVTDIDDPLFERADKLHTTWKELGDKWTKYLLNDFNFLNIEMPTHYVKATQEIPEMIKIIKVLIEKKHAYVKKGNVYFSIDTFPAYGKLSKLSTEQQLKVGGEMGNNAKDPLKKNPLDFLLWQVSKPTEPSWDSPWSKGRPGWHIECTAIIMKYLGEQIDIHGGGADLIFPHHESEIAQAESYTGEVPFVKTWMHCALVGYKGEKMSKSLGNLVYVQDLAKNYSANAIRYFLLSHHYRSEWEFFEKDMEKAAVKMKAIEDSLKTESISSENENAYIDVLGEDLNTPKALDYLLDMKDTEAKKKLFHVLGFK